MELSLHSSFCYSSSSTSSNVLLLLAGRRHCNGSSNRPVKRVGAARAYLEKPKNPFLQFMNRVQGSLPVIGLLTRILSDEGGIGDDRIHFVEFCTRVKKSCTSEASTAFYDFAERHGKVGNMQFVLIWCWAAALGAGLLKSEDILMSASRLRVSYDLQYEIDNLISLMDMAAEKRNKSGSPLPFVPMEARAEKALDAICRCCLGRIDIDRADANILTVILSAVFPSADKGELQKLVESRVTESAFSFSTEEFTQEMGTQKLQDRVVEKPQTIEQ